MGKLKPFLVSGCKAHGKPKSTIDFSRVIWALNIFHALSVYRERLRGVKKDRLLSACPVCGKGRKLNR